MASLMALRKMPISAKAAIPESQVMALCSAVKERCVA
jgi:hypothetical protein